MIDKATKLALTGPQAQTICGRTRIELTDTRTGKKKIVEHKNTFQSAYLTSYLRGLGLAKNSPFGNSTWAGRPLWRNLCGGILLFRDAITAPAEYAPATNLMVGNGSYGVTNNGNPAELGSYNSIESATGGSNSLTFVYDWGTSQGNGTIGCICLTSEDGGYIGYGNASGNSATLRSIINNQESTAAGANAYYNGQRIRIVDVDYTAKKITVAKSNDCVTIASIFEGQNETQSEISFTGSPVGEGDMNVFCRPVSETELFIFKSGTVPTIPSGSSGGLLFYDFTTDTAEVVTITNTSGKGLSVYESPNIPIVKDSAGNIYIKADGNNLAMFDSTGTFVRLYAGIPAIPGSILPGMVCAAANASSPIKIIYGADARPTNGFMTAQYMHFSDIDAMCRQDRTLSGENYLRPYKNPLYLATINNLDSAITKDSTQTMKIIYTLTEAGA